MKDTRSALMFFIITFKQKKQNKRNITERVLVNFDTAI